MSKFFWNQKSKKKKKNREQKMKKHEYLAKKKIKNAQRIPVSNTEENVPNWMKEEKPSEFVDAGIGSTI